MLWGFRRTFSEAFCSGGLRTLVRLEAADYPPEVAGWIEEQGIRIVQCATTRNREPFVSMDQAVLVTALRALLDHQNHPVLVHGLRGQQRTGVVVGCLRRLQRWSLSPTFDEYRRHAATASSLLDLQGPNQRSKLCAEMTTDRDCCNMP